MEILLSEQVADPENVRENFKKIKKALLIATGLPSVWGTIAGDIDTQLDLKIKLDSLSSQIPADAGNDLFNYYNFT